MTVLQKSRQIHLGKIIIIITVIIIIIIDNFCIALFSDVHKLTVLYNTLQHFLSENKIIKGNNVHESNKYVRTNKKYKVHVPYEKQQYIIQRDFFLNIINMCLTVILFSTMKRGKRLHESESTGTSCCDVVQMV